MSKYYVHNGKEQLGPYSLEYLKGLSWFNSQTKVWKEGFGDWVSAGDVEELKEVLNSRPPSMPPPANIEVPNKKSGYVWKIVIAILVVAISFFAYTIIANNPDSIPGVRLEVNTPKPRVLYQTGHAEKSNLLNSILTVEGTILNEGGEGRVLVTAHVVIDGRDHTQTKTIFMKAREQKSIEIDFDELTHLSTNVEYRLEVEI